MRIDVMRPPRSGRISTSHGPPRNLSTPRIVVSEEVRSLLAPALALCLLSACVPGRTAALPSPSPSASPTPTHGASPSPALHASPPHIFLIVMENRSYAQAISGGYTAKPASPYSVAPDYLGV